MAKIIAFPKPKNMLKRLFCNNAGITRTVLVIHFGIDIPQIVFKKSELVEPATMI
ncbi:hypothetical protein [Guptibacillus hwajinpoensis]|uniref:Uncharacterized protein n=1 Tax=Guptibacillus hwajinpoensis TaxID=208199 RepID=A0ABU0JZA8_9BACL|nr:hypothetical protein [Alkalihalobacillus hemicentroti]MDQ0482450.1 hypothetical protein [Alkalihalobacillus hemicentroti]